MRGNAGKRLSIVGNKLPTMRNQRTIDVPEELMVTVQAALRQVGLDVHPYVRRTVSRLAVRYSADVPTAAFVPPFLRFQGDPG